MPERLSRERLAEIDLLAVGMDGCEFECGRKVIPELLAHIAALEAENERLRAVAEAAKALIADPEWCSCSTINPNSRHAHDRPNLDYPATCAICGPTYCTGRTLNDALAALDEEGGE